MVAFDQPEPLASQGLRPVTTVAPQALMLLNGPQVRDWAEAFARRVRRETTGSAGLGTSIERAYLVALGRPAKPTELGEANAFLRRQTASYAAESKPDPALAALTDFCQVLFGLNEFAYEN